LSEVRQPIAEQPAPARITQVVPKKVPLSPAEVQQLAHDYRAQMLQAIHLDSERIDTRLSADDLRNAMLDAWRTLSVHGKKNDLLERLLKMFVEQQNNALDDRYASLKAATIGDERKINILDAIDDKVRNDLSCYFLLPEMHLIDNLINEIESAAQHDDGLRPDEEALKERLKFVQSALGRLELTDPMSWAEIKQGLMQNYDSSLPKILRFGQRRGPTTE
jgi:hypothetical protein